MLLMSSGGELVCEGWSGGVCLPFLCTRLFLVVGFGLWLGGLVLCGVGFWVPLLRVLLVRCTRAGESVSCVAVVLVASAVVVAVLVVLLAVLVVVAPVVVVLVVVAVVVVVVVCCSS